MAATDVGVFDADETAARLSAKFAGSPTSEVLRCMIEDLFPGRIALVSSFGSESAVLLHMVAQIDKSAPVLFINTGVLFQETLVYRDELIACLDLHNVTVVKPDKDQLSEEDPENFLWTSNPDRCCEIRKVRPLAKALEGYEAWITGRKRFQSRTRAGLALFEAEGGRVKVNPLAGWTATEINAYLSAQGLPRHPLVAKAYLSIGCIPCTSSVKPGEDPRAGRWRDRGKVECGLHTQALSAASES